MISLCLSQITQGATTGTGGRIRDIHATGKGAHEIAGVAGYSFGNLHLDGYTMPWEEKEVYPNGFGHPHQVGAHGNRETDNLTDCRRSFQWSVRLR